jgi:hypothetical protein
MGNGAPGSPALKPLQEEKDMKQISSVVLVSALATALLIGQLAATSALAGIVDTPLPTLVAGKKTLHVYSVSGVGGGAGGLFGTYFSCTSTDAATIQVGVEVFPRLGGGPANDAVATSLAVAPGQTVLFGTRNATGIINLDSDLAAGIVVLGSARILGTSKKLTCSAFLAEITSAPPISMVQLNVIKQKTQKGD